MPAPLSTSGQPADAQTWHELEQVFAELGQLARTSCAPEKFYGRLLDECVRALSATGGAVWLRSESAALRPIAQLHWPGAAINDDDARRAHEAVLTQVAAGGQVVTIMPRPDGATDHALVIAPVQVLDQRSTVALIEIHARADASPATYRGYEQFLAAVCELAADYHAHRELLVLRSDEHYRNELLRLSRRAHGQLDLTATAYIVANEGRRVIGCDRLSVLVARGTSCRLLATSGVGRVERRSNAARHLEELAELVRRTNEPAWYNDGDCDALPPIAAAIERHAEESHARQVAAVPIADCGLRIADYSSRIRHGADSDGQGSTSPPRIVLVAEQFDAGAGALRRERLVEVGDVCGTALYNALEVDQLPLGWLLRPLARFKQFVAAHLSRAALVAAAVVATLAALVFVPADFRVEATGTLQPAVRRDVFAPRSGLVDEVLVAHGDDVTAGDPLVRLRDPLLDLELKRAYGELETAQRQLDAVLATKTNRAIRDANPTDVYRLSAEERELEQRLTNLRDELALLDGERTKLLVASPIAGRVLTWDANCRLDARPVERGEVLLTVADLDAEWQLELDVPDDRIGHLLAAQQELGPELPVRFRLSSDDRERHTGHVAEVCLTANVDASDSSPSPTVLVKVALPKKGTGPLLTEGDGATQTAATKMDLSPFSGVAARAQIDCGRRPLGYVWLHDIWHAVIGWLRF